MAKPEWGTKRICHSCGTRYYDMRNPEPACPSCGTVFDPEAFLKSRRTRTVVVEEEAPRKVASAKVAAVVDDEAELEEVEEEAEAEEEEEEDVEEVEEIEVEEADLEAEDAEEDADAPAGRRVPADEAEDLDESLEAPDADDVLIDDSDDDDLSEEVDIDVEPDDEEMR